MRNRSNKRGINGVLGAPQHPGQQFSGRQFAGNKIFANQQSLFFKYI